MQNVFFKYFPIIGFILLWAFVIGLHQLSLYNLRDISGYTYFVLYVSLASLILGYYLSSIYGTSPNHLKVRTHKLVVDTSLLIKGTIILTLFLTIGGFLSMYVVGNNLGGLDVYINRPLLVRQFIIAVQLGNENVSELYRLGGYLTNIGFISVTFGGILFATKGKKRLIGLLPFVGLLISQLASMGRYRFVTGIVFFFVAFILYSSFLDPLTRKVRLREIFLYGLISIIIVLTLSYFIIKFRSPLADDIIGFVKETGYLYFTGGISALDKFLLTDFHFTYGESSFRTVFKWLARFGFLPEESVVSTHNKFVKVSPSYKLNTYTFIKSLYQDFGLPGLMFISFCWGLLTKFSLNKVYENFNLVNIVLASIFVFSLIISFFSFYFQGITSIIFWVLVAIMIHYIWGDRLFYMDKYIST